MADETKIIEAVIGPYRGQRLTVSAADGDQAINDHWAVDPFPDPEAEPHPPLDEEERTHALEAAIAWRDAQLKAAAGEQPEPEAEPKAMTSSSGGNYETR